MWNQFLTEVDVDVDDAGVGDANPNARPQADTCHFLK